MVRVPAYISTIISATADDGPDEMMSFPAGLHYLLTFPARIPPKSQKLMCLYANFSEKGCLYIAIYATFSKRENEWIVWTRGESHLFKAFISNGNNREMSACFPNVNFSQIHLSKSNNLDRDVRARSKYAVLTF